MKTYLLALAFIVLNTMAYSQEKNSRFTRADSKYVGLLIGSANQKNFPFSSNDYIYSSTHLKLQFNKKLWEWGAWDAHITVEPGFYRVDHQLLNLFFITPDNANFEARRERFLQPRTFNEYALNIGLRMSRNVFKNINAYGLISSGPMYAEQSTEHLKGGFAFSNVFGAGIQYKLSKNWRWDARIIARHTSNAGTKRPNSGHNSFGAETGVIFMLN